MTNRRDGTNKNWSRILSVLGVFVVIATIAYVIETGTWGWNLRPASGSFPVLRTQSSLQARVETLEAQVSLLSREISYLQATAEVLDDSTPVPTPTRTPRPIPGTDSQTLIVTVERGNVRTGPSTDFQVIGYVQQGQILEGPFSRQNGWYRFCCVNEDQYGWVSGILVREQSPTTPTSSTSDTGSRSQTESSQTSIASPPASLGVDPIYKKYLDAGGVPILAPADVSDKAMDLAHNILVGMVSTRHDLFAVLVVVAFESFSTTTTPQSWRSCPDSRTGRLAPRQQVSICKSIPTLQRPRRRSTFSAISI